MTAVAPLDDPRYVPRHPPVGGRVPDVVAKWGPRSQVRYVAARADQPPISNQIARLLAMYLDHAMAHAGIPTT